MKTLLGKTLSTAFLAAALVFSTQAVHATTLTFDRITNNSSIDVAGQLSADITDLMDGTVLFTVFNDVGTASSVTDVYFDLGSASDFSLFEYSAANSSSGVSFDTNPHPGDLPSGSNVGFSADFGGDSTTPTTAMGVDAADEFVSFIATLGAGFNFDALLADIASGDFRIGLHVQAIFDQFSLLEDGESDSFVSMNPVPLPAAAWLFGSALFGLFAARRRKVS